LPDRSFPALVAGASQQLFVFVLPHFFPAFLDDAAQPITPFPYESKIFIAIEKDCTIPPRFQPLYRENSGQSAVGSRQSAVNIVPIFIPGGGASTMNIYRENA